MLLLQLSSIFWTEKKKMNWLLVICNLRKFYSRHHDMVDRHGMFASKVTMNMLPYHASVHMSNTTSATNGTGTADLSGAPEYNPDACCPFVFCVVFCRPLFVFQFPIYNF
jgi:hypothetical protein